MACIILMYCFKRILFAIRKQGGPYTNPSCGIDRHMTHKTTRTWQERATVRPVYGEQGVRGGTHLSDEQIGE